MDSQSIRDLESEKKIWSGQCRVSRMWFGVNVHTDKVLHFDLILMDSKGNDIWVQIPLVLIEKFKKMLKENHVYIIKNFDINTTGMKYRPIGNPYLIKFSRKTTVHHVPEVPAIPTFKFSFLNASQMAGKLGHVEILSDVVGQLRTHSDAITTTSLTRKTIRKGLTLQLIEGDVVKVVIWGRVIQQFDKIIDAHGDDQTILVISAVSVGDFKDELSFLSSGSTVVYRNLDIPAVKAFATGYRVQLEVQSDLKSAVFVLFEYEGKRYFGFSGHELFLKNGQNGDLPPDELLQLVGLTKKFHVKFKINLFADSQADFTVLRILEPTSKGEGYMIHKDGSSSSIASGPASSQPSSDQSGQSAIEKSIATPVDSDATPDNKLKRKMPLE
ncbi:unnamed protein product [Linum tenue]|uniref:Replication protein A 70 kDa DNA-binding subunit B/D first OB fold domain-containing protein n=1 Tax=Linum tenue TaxID=586396 RepID=A0AAV0NP39_9ROSI|nr:unnamed protein product [Linum tenue]